MILKWWDTNDPYPVVESNLYHAIQIYQDRIVDLETGKAVYTWNGEHWQSRLGWIREGFEPVVLEIISHVNGTQFQATASEGEVLYVYDEGDSKWGLDPTPAHRVKDSLDTMFVYRYPPFEDGAVGRVAIWTLDNPWDPTRPQEASIEWVQCEGWFDEVELLVIDRSVKWSLLKYEGGA